MEICPAGNENLFLNSFIEKNSQIGIITFKIRPWEFLIIFRTDLR